MIRVTVIDAVADVSAWVSNGRARELREAAGLSLTDAAQEIQVGPSALWRWEHGQRRPRGRNLRAYHRFLRALDARARRIDGQVAA